MVEVWNVASRRFEMVGRHIDSRIYYRETGLIFEFLPPLWFIKDVIYRVNRMYNLLWFHFPIWICIKWRVILFGAKISVRSFFSICLFSMKINSILVFIFHVVQIVHIFLIVYNEHKFLKKYFQYVNKQ